jgi:predicted AlkP superfamily phosphohydrolase/phosphomutase
MKQWKVIVNVNVNNSVEQKTVFIRDAKNKEEAYSKAKKYFILERPEINFHSVESATQI